MISIIIPTYNEGFYIRRTIRKLRQYDNTHLIKEIIVVDGGSTDDTVAVAKSEDVRVVWSPKKGRATQMNYGASLATGDILYFLHADTVPPESFSSYILEAKNKGAIAGCFRLAFDQEHWFLKACCWFTRFNINAVRFGDQSLFVTKVIFLKSGRFREDLLLMEDQEIIHRIKKQGKFKVMEAVVTTSARKYMDNGIYRLQAIFFCIWLFYYLGCSQRYLLKIHGKLIRDHSPDPRNPSR